MLPGGTQTPFTSAWSHQSEKPIPEAEVSERVDCLRSLSGEGIPEWPPDLPFDDRRKTPHLLFVPCQREQYQSPCIFSAFSVQGIQNVSALCLQSTGLFSGNVSENPSGEAVSQWWGGRSTDGISELWDTAGRVEMLWIGTRHLRKHGDLGEKTKHC